MYVNSGVGMISLGEKRFSRSVHCNSIIRVRPEPHHHVATGMAR